MKNAVVNTQLRHRRESRLNQMILEAMQRCDGNGIALDGTFVDCDVCAVGKCHQLAHSKKTLKRLYQGAITSGGWIFDGAIYSGS